MYSYMYVSQPILYIIWICIQSVKSALAHLFFYLTLIRLCLQVTEILYDCNLIRILHVFQYM